MRLIDADALIRQIEDNICKPCRKRKDDYKGVRCKACEYGNEKDDIDSAPTVEERKKGKWIPLQLSMPYPPYQCSCCFSNAPMVETGCLMNRHLEASLTDFCPNCGADMRGEENGTD